MDVMIDQIGFLCRRRGIDARELARRGGLSIVVALQLRDGAAPKQSYRIRHLEVLCEVLHAQPGELLQFVDPYEYLPAMPSPARGAGEGDAAGGV